MIEQQNKGVYHYNGRHLTPAEILNASVLAIETNKEFEKLLNDLYQMGQRDMEEKNARNAGKTMGQIYYDEVLSKIPMGSVAWAKFREMTNAKFDEMSRETNPMFMPDTDKPGKLYFDDGK